MTVSFAEFEELALADPGKLELHAGTVIRRPAMNMAHNDVTMELAFALLSQLNGKQYRIRSQAGHARAAASNSFVPDVMVIPVELVARLRGSRALETYDEPLPFVAEVWSPSTGGYDVMTKLPQYRARGDAEIWLVHPHERTVTAWRRQPDGTYNEASFMAGTVAIASLPGVTVELGSLFEWA